MSARSVAVIGGGVAGLAAAKSLREEGLEPTVFEKSSHLGGLWHYDEGAPGGGGPAYQSLRTNVSRHSMGFSDHPIPDAFPDFPSHGEILEYLESYAERFDLGEDLRLEHEVVSARRSGDRWEVRARSGGQESIRTLDAVVVCSGRHQAPRWPDLEGREAFQGELVHSLSYKDPAPFAGRTVLVIGVGSSGVDLAEELAPVARRVLLSAPRGAWIIPRTVGGRPYDHNVTRLGDLLPQRLREKVFRRLVGGEYRRRGIDLAGSDLPLPDFDLRRARLTPGDDLLRLVAEGDVEVVPGVRRLEPDGVELAGGRREPVDVVLAATGYRVELPFLEAGSIPESEGAPILYKHVFAPRLDGLAFVGLPWVTGAYPPVLELQARWAARVLAGRCELPPPAVMEDRVERAVQRARDRGVRFDRVQPIEYMNDVAREIGCHPRPWRHPRLLIPLLTGPLLPAHYRLDGPGRWAAAAETIAAAGRRA